MRRRSAAVGGFIGGVCAAAISAPFLLPQQVGVYAGISVAGYLVGSALGRVAWGIW